MTKILRHIGVEPVINSKLDRQGVAAPGRGGDNLGTIRLAICDPAATIRDSAHFRRGDEVNARLQSIMKRAFSEVLETAKRRTLAMRMAAYVQAVSRVAAATRDRGLYP